MSEHDWEYKSVDWAYSEIAEEITQAKNSPSRLLDMYKRESKSMVGKVLYLVYNKDKMTEQGEQDYRKEIDFIHKSKVEIALALADILTK